jgi:hypothetical protein
MIPSAGRISTPMKRTSPEEFEAFAQEVEAHQAELLRIIERREAAAKARRLRRRRLFGLLPL